MVGQVAADKWLRCRADVAGCRGMSRDVAKMSRKCRGDVAGCRGDVAGCRGDVVEMSPGVASVSPSVTEMSTHVTLRSTRRHVDTHPLRWGVPTTWSFHSGVEMQTRSWHAWVCILGFGSLCRPIVT